MPREGDSGSDEAVGFFQVFAAELRDHVGQRRQRAEPKPEFSPDQLTPEGAFDLGLTGLALSGGGIRSATFNLGLLQALAERGVLARCDYLSTVSGGGYIGASLTSLCSEPGVGVSPETFPFRRGGGTEPPELAHLREHAFYLTPRRGLLQADTWRLTSAYLAGLVLVLLTVAVILAFVAVGAHAFAESAVKDDLEKKRPDELWMALLQKRIDDVDFERVPESGLRDAFIAWARPVQAIVLEERLKSDLATWIGAASTETRDKLREQVDIWVHACREYARDRERLWAALIAAVPPDQLREHLKASQDGDPLRSMQAVLGLSHHQMGMLREWWIGQVQEQLPRARFDDVADDKLESAFNEWALGFGDVTGQRISIDKKEDPNLLSRILSRITRFVLRRGPDQGTRATIRELVDQWNKERISRNLLERFQLHPYPMTPADMRGELSNDAWRHPTPYARPLMMLLLAPVAFLVLVAVLSLSASVLFGRAWSFPLRHAFSRSLGYSLAFTAAIAVLAAVPFVYAAASASLRMSEAAGLSTLAASVLSLVTSLRLGLVEGGWTRKTRRVLFSIGGWGLIALFCGAILYCFITLLLQDTANWLLRLDTAVIILVGLALVTDINRVSLLYFYRDRLAEAYLIRRSRPASDRRTGREEGNPVGRAPESAGARVLWRSLVRSLHRLGAWPLVALLAIAPVIGNRYSETAFLVSFASVCVLLASGAFAALVAWYRDLLWRSPALAGVRGKGEGSEIARNDRLRLSELAAKPSDAPYHLINTTVNLAGSQDLKLRGRKADFFLLSPLYCGSTTTGYVRTGTFERSLDDLGTAMAVSGGATSALYGRATHPAFGFLMALCNLRLGMWIQNPRYVRCQKGVRLWLREALLHVERWWPYYLVKELLGRSDERGWHVNLSDGGHIENLGVFELLRRRCRLIIASDAGADPTYELGDLGDLAGMARVDLGVEIRGVDGSKLRPRKMTGLSQRHAVVGEIHYPGQEVPGRLIYVKAAVTPEDPADLQGYRGRHSSFPHQTTIDQFFDEGQFEAYRMLGYVSGLEAADLLDEGTSVKVGAERAGAAGQPV